MNNPAPILTGSGELRLQTGIGEAARYAGQIPLGGRTIELGAQVASDARGRYFAITGNLDPETYTEAQLDQLLSAAGAGLTVGSAKRTRCGPLIDDPIPFGAA